MSNQSQSLPVSAWGVFIAFLKLGLTSFGGPIAHLGYFRDEFVGRRKWFSDESYADLVALCQFLPGPASSQVGIAIGLSQAGYRGALGAWLGFTLPSAIALILFALGIATYSDYISDGILHGLKIAAVAIVAQAILGMGRSLCPDTKRISIMAITACFVLWQPSVFGQIIAIIVSGFIGAVLLQAEPKQGQHSFFVPITPKAGIIWLSLFMIIFIALPILSATFPSKTLEVIDIFYRTGSLVFGGGHVVLPLLQAELVPSGIVDNDLFLAGYGATQAVPGPLFTIASFLGATMESGMNSWIMGFITLLAVFLPSFLLVFGVLPFWDMLRHHQPVRSVLMGVNASVVGLLVAAFYQPVWTSSIFNAQDFGLAIVAFVALNNWNCPPWAVVVGCAIIAWLLAM